MQPQFRLLSDALTDQIIDEARDILASLGVAIHNPAAVELLFGHGARVADDGLRVFMDGPLIDQALASSPSSVKLYDVDGELAADLGGDRVHFTPGSAAINYLDRDTQVLRRPGTPDYVDYARLVRQLPALATQSTCMVPDDVPEPVGDSYRLYLSLIHCPKPVVTGCFTVEAYSLMLDMQRVVRGDAQALRDKPLCLFSCCPTSPLKWSDVTSQNVIDCARDGVPVEFISMPLTGFLAPVTLVGSLVAHCAETLSGVVLSQCAQPGAPMLYGGSPAVFDLRYETTPMGAVETQMIDCGYAEIGRSMGLPTQAYMAMSDAKLLDAQAGFETAMGATLASLAGINNISGPGMLDFENAFSLDKLVLDNEICLQTLRLKRGIEPREDFPARPHFEELLAEGHLLISEHTRRHLRDEISFPGPVVDRANRARWVEEGSTTLRERSARQIERLLSINCAPSLAPDRLGEIKKMMHSAARAHGQDRLPPESA